MICKKCSAEVVPGSIICPYCLKPLDGRKKLRKIIIIAAAVVCAAVAAAAVIILL